MKVTDDGVPVEILVDAVKAAIKKAKISTANTDRQLRVGQIQLTLNAVATGSTGVKFEFKIPFIGMKLSVGGKVTSSDTHTIDISLVPPEDLPSFQTREIDVDDVLVDAIETVGAAMVRAAGGEDPFVLKESTVEINFAVTEEGSIDLGVSGEHKSEVKHTLKLTLVDPK